MTATPELLAAVTGSHTALRRAEVRSPGGSLLAELPVSDGNITGTYGQARRWSAELQIPARPDLIPRQPGDLLHPLSGNEVWLHAGVRLASGDQWLPWGKYPITSAPVERASGGTSLSLSLEDRSELVDSQEWVYPYQSLSGAVAPAIAGILADRAPGFEHDLADLSGTVNSQVYTNSAPWADAVKLARDTGHDLALDLDGVARGRAVPDPASATPYRSYGPGGLRLLTKVGRTLTREGVHTGVVVWAQDQANQTVYFAVEWDENSASPTYSGMAGGVYVGSPLGRRPRRIDSSRIGNQATADQAAAAEMRRLRGSGDGYRVALPVDPSMDVARIVAVQFDAQSAMETCFVQQVVFPWKVEGEMTLDLRTTMPTDAT